MRKNHFLHSLAVLFLCLCPAVAAAQNQNSQVEVNDDEFSGKRKVTLLEQQIAPELKMKITATVQPEKKRGRYDADLGHAEIEFTTSRGSGAFGPAGADAEVNFMVDGERVRGSQLQHGPMLNLRRKDTEIALAVVFLSSLEKIASGREVKMKVAEGVYQLDKAVLKNLQEFVKALGR